MRWSVRAADALVVPMETNSQTLGDLLNRLGELDDGLTIYAEETPTWHSGSLAVVGTETEDGRPPKELEGMRYFLEVSIAKEIAEGFSSAKARIQPTPQEICERIIHYAKYDA